MNVNNKHMYHFHKKGFKDELWQVGNILNIDDNFDSRLYRNVLNFNTNIQYGDDVIASILIGLNSFKQTDYETISIKDLKQFLEYSRKIINNATLTEREFALEEYRKKYFPNLPSRFHSIWLTDKKSLNHWLNAFDGSNRDLFELEVSGNLFKSCDDFLPTKNETLIECFYNSENYWNPNFKSPRYDKNKVEYLFQGQARVLRKVNNIKDL